MKAAIIPRWSVQDRLIKARDVADLSQTQLAHRLGVSLSTVRRIERGEKPANRMEMYGWAVACGVDPEWIIDGEGGDAAHDAITLQESSDWRQFSASPIETVAAA